MKLKANVDIALKALALLQIIYFAGAYAMKINLFFMAMLVLFMLNGYVIIRYGRND